VRKGINWPLLTATIVLFGFAVTDLGLSLQETLLASEGLSDQVYTVMSVSSLKLTNYHRAELSPEIHRIVFTDFN